jgi:hypothetical protein
MQMVGAIPGENLELSVAAGQKELVRFVEAINLVQAKRKSADYLVDV